MKFLTWQGPEMKHPSVPRRRHAGTLNPKPSTPKPKPLTKHPEQQHGKRPTSKKKKRKMKSTGPFEAKDQVWWAPRGRQKGL